MLAGPNEPQSFVKALPWGEDSPKILNAFALQPIFAGCVLTLDLALTFRVCLAEVEAVATISTPSSNSTSLALSDESLRCLA
jgi:hypothetical protein